MMKREGYLEQFLEFWDFSPGNQTDLDEHVTPQIGERSEEILSREERERAIAIYCGCVPVPKLEMKTRPSGRLPVRPRRQGLHLCADHAQHLR